MWSQGRLWNDRFQWIIQIPLRKLLVLESTQVYQDDYYYTLWSLVLNQLDIPGLTSRHIINLFDKEKNKKGILILDGIR